MAPSNAHLRLLILGGAGAGKTTTANAILGQDAFQEAPTIGSSVQTRTISGRCISLIDTPRSLLGSCSSDEQNNGEYLEKCLSLAAPGPHAFLLVFPLGTNPVSDEGFRVVEWIGQQLGEEALRMTVILFTRRERVTRREWDQFLLKQEVQKLIRTCGGGYHIMNSKAEVEPCQVTELIEKVDAIVKRRGGDYYMIDRFLQAQRRDERKEKEERKWGDMRREMELRKQKREEENRREEEERKRREEERKKKELQELQERERRRKKREEHERAERERRTLEEVRKRQEQERQRLEEEERQQEEVRQRLEQERRQQEEVQQKLEEKRRLQEKVAEKLEEEKERQEQEIQRLVQERKRMEEEERRREENQQQVARGGGRGRGEQQQEDGGWRTAERCAAVLGAFIAPIFRR